MPKRLLRLSSTILAALAFAAAGVVMLVVAFLSALVIEMRSDTVVSTGLQAAGMDWVTVASDGLQVQLGGTAPDERARFRALNLVGTLVDSSRIRDSLEVTPASALAAPRFSVEMLRNDDGIQLIGLLPEVPEAGGIDETALVAAAEALTPGIEVDNLLEAAAWPAPETWNNALSFGIEALKVLKRSKVSVAADRVEVTAIAESAAEKRQLEAALNARKPAGVGLLVEISAPRPVLTPFTLRFIKDDQGARFDACAADSPRARLMILRAAEAAGLPEGADCTIGLGVPTPRWADGIAAGIKAVGELGNATLTFNGAVLGSNASFGNASGAVEAFNLGILSAKGSLYVTRPTMNTHTAKRETLVAMAKNLFEAVGSGKVSVAINARFALKDAADAHRALEGRGTTGSTVIIP